MNRNLFSMPVVLLLVLSQCWADMAVAEDNPGFEKASSDVKMDNRLKAPGLDLTPRLPDAANNADKLIMVPPGTERVFIQQSNYEFKEEAKSFRRFRWHYMAYFSLWFTMMVTNVSWEE